MAFRLSVQTTLPVPFVSVSTANLEPVEMSSTTTFAKKCRKFIVALRQLGLPLTSFVGHGEAASFV
jgi:hypothetical protein